MSLTQDAINFFLGREPPRQRPAAFDPAHPNFNGYGEEHRMIFRITDRLSGRLIREVLLQAHVSTWSKTPETRVALHYTADGVHTDIPEGDARGMSHFNIAGTSGVFPAGRVTGAPDGMAALAQLRKLINDYYRAEIDGQPREQFRLEFLNPDTPITADDPGADGEAHWEIQFPKQALIINRDARRAATYQFQMRFSGVHRIEGFQAQLLRLEAAKRNFFEKILDAVAALSAFSFDQVFVKYKALTSPFTRSLAAIGDVERFLDEWSRGIDEFLAYNTGLIDDLISDMRAISRTLNGELGVNQGQRFGPDGSIMRNFESTRRLLDRTNWAIQSRPSIQREKAPPIGASADARATVKSLVQEEAANTRHLSTPDRDARRALALSGSRSFASVGIPIGAGKTLEDFLPPGFTIYDLIRANNLAWPFVDGNRTRPIGEPFPAGTTPRVLYVGDVIQVPVARGTPGVTSEGDSFEAAQSLLGPGDADERVFGIDWMVDEETRSLVFDDATGDLRVRRGLDNLLQALRQRLRLPLASLHYAPDEGSHLLEESRSGWATNLKLRLNAIAARRTLQADPRVERVRHLEASVFNGQIAVQFTLDTIDGTPRGRVALSA